MSPTSSRDEASLHWAFTFEGLPVQTVCHVYVALVICWGVQFTSANAFVFAQKVHTSRRAEG